MNTKEKMRPSTVKPRSTRQLLVALPLLVLLGCGNFGSNHQEPRLQSDSDDYEPSFDHQEGRHPLCKIESLLHDRDQIRGLIKDLLFINVRFAEIIAFTPSDGRDDSVDQAFGLFDDALRDVRGNFDSLVENSSERAKSYVALAAAQSRLALGTRNLTGVDPSTSVIPEFRSKFRRLQDDLQAKYMDLASLFCQ